MKLFKSLFILLLFIFTIESRAQMQTTSNLSPALNTNQNPFLDASTYFDISFDPSSAGKGMVFPRTDLTTFTFRIENMDGINFPTAFDGMIVYNAATGNTLAAVSGNNGVVTAVTPGFYYFSNPNGAVNGNVISGIWIPLGNTASKNITATAIATAISVDGTPVYAIKGQFTTVINSAITTIVPPTGITGVYRITIFKGTSTLVFSPTVHSFDFSKMSDNVVTGDTMFTQVYPIGTYNYTLEYFK